MKVELVIEGNDPPGAQPKLKQEQELPKSFATHFFSTKMGPQQLLVARLMAVGMTAIVVATATKKYLVDPKLTK